MLPYLQRCIYFAEILILMIKFWQDQMISVFLFKFHIFSVKSYVVAGYSFELPRRGSVIKHQKTV